MYILILHTTLLVSNTKITDSLVKLKNNISEFELTWPTTLTFHNGRIYDFNRVQMEGIRALAACLNREREMYFIQKRDDIRWMFQKKEESNYYNESYGNSFWVNFHFSEKSRKVLGPRRQIVPLMTDTEDRISWDRNSRIQTKNDCL